MEKEATFKSPVYKCVLVGDGGVGKTTYCKSFSGVDQTNKKYLPTVGTEVNELKFHTNYGPVTFNVWDTAGEEKFGFLRDKYYVDGDCGIIMFDVTSRYTYKNIPSWHRDVTRICKNIPICMVGNKVDKTEDRKVKSKQINFHLRKNMPYYETSAKTNYGIFKPFEWLARKLTGISKLVFVNDATAGPPPEVKLSEEDIKKLEQEFQNVRQKIELPSEDDDF